MSTLQIDTTPFLPPPDLETWGELVEFSTWVVFSAHVGSKEVWAWCLTGNGPGFRSVVYSNPDGRLDPPVEIEDAPNRLDSYLFTHTCPVESS